MTVVDVDRNWLAEWEEIVSGIKPESASAEECEVSDRRGIDVGSGGLGDGRTPVRRPSPWAKGSLRPESALRRFLLEALSDNSPEKVVAAVRAMRSAGFEGEVMAEVRPYLSWEGEASA